MIVLKLGSKMKQLSSGNIIAIQFKLAGDLLNNYCQSDDLMNVSRLLFCLTILLTSPIEVSYSQFGQLFFSMSVKGTEVIILLFLITGVRFTRYCYQHFN